MMLKHARCALSGSDVALMMTFLTYLQRNEKNVIFSTLQLVFANCIAGKILSRKITLYGGFLFDVISF